MRIAYLIVAHDNPQHLTRLVNAISTGNSSCFIHINRNSELNGFSHIKGDNVSICEKRIPVYRGDFTFIEAVLELIRLALNDRRGFDYAVMLSGVDYPLRSTCYVERFFERHQGTQFMSTIKMPATAWGKPISRLTKFKPRPGDSCVFKTATYFMNILGWRRDFRSWLGNLQPYGGDFWSGLTREACEYIQEFVRRETQFVRFYQNTLFPDESFFHTILANSPFNGKMKRCVMYTDWSEGGSRPACISEKHMGLLESNSPIILNDRWGRGEVLFARKFSDESKELVDRIDQIRSRTSHAGG